MEGNEDEEADDDSADRTGENTRAGDQKRVLGYLGRDQPGRVAGKGEDKPIGEVDETEDSTR